LFLRKLHRLFNFVYINKYFESNNKDSMRLDHLSNEIIKNNDLLRNKLSILHEQNIESKLDNANSIKFDYTFEQVQLFNNLNKENKNNSINNFKVYSLPIFIVIVFFISWFSGKNGFSNYSFTKLQSTFTYELLNCSILFYLICFSIISLIFIWLIAYLTHKFVYNKLGSNSTEPVKIKYNKLLLLLSPDLYYANLYKEQIKLACKKNKSLLPKNISEETMFKDTESIDTIQWNHIKIQSKYFVENCNWININLTVVGIGLIYIFTIILKSSLLNEFLLTLMIFRLISRGIEVTIAFYNDVVNVNSKLFILSNESTFKSYYINGFKSTLIRQSGRLSLAIHTLIELTLLYGFIYYLYFNIIVDIPSAFADIDTPPPTFFEMLLFSSSLGLFNISYNAYANILLALFHSSQVFLSGVLILLSIAQYIGADKSLSPEEETFYRHSELLSKQLYKKRIEDKFQDDKNSFLPRELNS